MTTSQFASGSISQPPNLGGPDFGVISANEINAGGQEAIRDTIRIALTLGGTVPSNLVDLIQAGSVGVSFGSPDSSNDHQVPEPGSLSVLVVGLGLLGSSVRRRTQ